MRSGKVPFSSTAAQCLVDMPAGYSLGLEEASHNKNRELNTSMHTLGLQTTNSGKENHARSGKFTSNFRDPYDLI